MQLYHFDAHGADGICATESRPLASTDAARRHAVSIALQITEQTAPHDIDGSAVVVEAYTAEEGVVLTLRLVVSVEIKRNNV